MLKKVFATFLGVLMIASVFGQINQSINFTKSIKAKVCTESLYFK